MVHVCVMDLQMGYISRAQNIAHVNVSTLEHTTYILVYLFAYTPHPYMSRMVL